jgi:hypothetical protein
MPPRRNRITVVKSENQSKAKRKYNKSIQPNQATIDYANSIANGHALKYTRDGGIIITNQMK